MENSLAIPSTVYNGDTMTKLEVMEYLCEMAMFWKEFDQYEEQRRKIRAKMDANLMQQKRRSFPLVERERPTGLAALSPRKRREYEYWLSKVDERKREKERLEAEEDVRIETLCKQWRELELEHNAVYVKEQKLTEDFKELCFRHILAPDYRKRGIPELLLCYLYNGRAHTLTDAINLYHQELHWGKMEEIAKDQARQVQASLYYQEQTLREQVAEERVWRQEISEAMDDTRRAAQEAKFYAELSLLFS